MLSLPGNRQTGTYCPPLACQGRKSQRGYLTAEQPATLWKGENRYYWGNYDKESRPVVSGRSRLV
jgi:hypothetical protein